MYLKLDKFDELAKQYGYRDACELICALGCTEQTYQYLCYGGKIDSDLIAEIYNRFGDDVMFDVIDFGEDGQ